ncbi:uncharacterized protein LOC110037478 [Phalaenopsis equestris]|uniref:uncharacterized protein LOC110037478 n=1 Tax=Phalaenopsis equestris TaxID=78828 RepID=UPI0009E2838A|nr:uncharacterized protein LOC110037478 [Phalaenopsis equestris]
MAELNNMDLSTNVQWTKATFADVVGKGVDTVKDFNDLVFPQSYHEAAGSFIKPLSRKNGKVAMAYNDSEIQKLIEMGHQAMEAIRKFFDGIKLKGAWRVGLIDGRHILQIDGITMKILKWSTAFDPSKELPVVPIRFKLPGLKLHFFNHNVLFNIRQALGKPLKLDVPTYNLSRPSVAKILVERDITLPIVEEIWLGTEHNGYWQRIVAEQKPYYFFHCSMFGHTDNRCYKRHQPSPSQKNSEELLGGPLLRRLINYLLMWGC